MQPFPTRISWDLPSWFSERLLDKVLSDDNAKMSGAIELARASVEHGGGPFGAIVIDRQTSRVIAAAANQVLQGNCSILHAEILALAAAQARIQHFTLAGGDYELVSSSEPCAQCLGAIFWSGIQRLVCGALLEDAEALGFDEGPRREDWQDQLLARGVDVTTGILRRQANAVLQEYVRRGGAIYNARS